MNTIGHAVMAAAMRMLATVGSILAGILGLDPPGEWWEPPP
jgi:hypothetical protein